MSKFKKPTIIVSKCLGFANCRYDGEIIKSDFVEKLKPYVHFKHVCPELEIGLGVPRKPIRIVEKDQVLKLVQTESHKDLSRDMKRFSEEYLASLSVINGFILKSRSPSCGIKDTKVYSSLDNGRVIRKTTGFFGEKVRSDYPGLPVEDDGRLNDPLIQEKFLTRVFALAGFEAVKKSRTIKGLIEFHARYKYLLMSFNQIKLKTLGKIVANKDKKPFSNVISEYENEFYKAIDHSPSFKSNINVLMHIMGYFKDRLSSKEKSLFLDSLEKYRIGQLQLRVPKNILKSWIVRFDEQYLQNQAFLEPYPEKLIDINEVCS